MNSLSSALSTIRRSPYQALAAIMLLSLTFFVAYAFSLFIIGSEIVLKYFETQPQVIAFFDIEADADQINPVSQAMSEKNYVSEIKLISKEEALEIYKQENQDDPLLLELVTAQILPASIEVSAREIADLTKIKQDLENFDQIDEVVLQQDIIDSLSTWTLAIRIIGLVSIIILSLVSFLMMLIIIGMKVVSKRPAIKIMRLIGASKFFIKSPFVFEGVIYGLMSSVLGFSLTLGCLLYLTPYIENFLGSVANQLFPIPLAFFALQFSVGTLIGIVFGAFAGATSAGRMIKR